MIKFYLICLALIDMNGVVNQKQICHNVRAIKEVTEKYNIEPELYVSLLWQESKFTPNITSPRGACGISQVLPKYTDVSCKELTRFNVGLNYGAKALSYWYHKYADEDINTAICAYNAGFRCKNEKKDPRTKKIIKRVRKYYVKPILSFRQRLKKSMVRSEKKYKKVIDFIKVYF